VTAVDDAYRRYIYLTDAMECRLRIPTAIGEAERVIWTHYNLRVMSLVRRHLIRQAEEFRSLEAIFKLVEQHIPGDGPEKLRVLRKQRNRIAHGDQVTEREMLSLKDTCEVLNAVLDLIFLN
jgi:hypothetical protein